jgi:hypothetical protein
VCCLAVAVFMTLSPVHSCADGKALLVGVEDYPDPRYRLPGVRADVALIKDVLIKSDVFKPDQIKVLTDKAATKRNIVQAFKEWLILGTDPGDTALFYFSGHGVQVWDESGDESVDARDEALMAWDAIVPKDFARRTIAGKKEAAFDSTEARNFLLDDEIRELLSQMQDRTVVFFSDSCHSGTVYKRLNPRFVKHKTILPRVVRKGVFEPRRATEPSVPRPRGNSGLATDLAAKGVRIASFTASDDSQLADVVYFDQYPKGYHSVFSWHLYHGLAGLADRNGDGNITFGELGTYLSNEIRAAGYHQTPRFHFVPSMLHDQPFGKRAATEKRALVRPSNLACYIQSNTPSLETERTQIQDSLATMAKQIVWAKRPSAADCIVDMAKERGVYGARLSDPSGRYWETHQSSSRDRVLDELLKDLRALYVQRCVAALRNPRRGIDLQLEYAILGNPKRTRGEVVSGDGLLIKATTDRPSFLLVFSVDTSGVIHPLYPGPDAGFKEVTGGRTAEFGKDGSFTVQQPFGREMVFVVATVKEPTSLIPFWKHDDIGLARSNWLTEQIPFLDALWNELAPLGIPKGSWASRMWLLESFAASK